jgi:hypothetical protein
LSSARLTSISSSGVSSLELGFTVEHGRTVSYACPVDEVHDAGYGTWWLVRGSEEFYEVCHPWVAEGSYVFRAAAAYAALFGGPWRPVELGVVGELHHRMVLRDVVSGAEAVVDVVLSEHGEAVGGEHVTVTGPTEPAELTGPAEPGPVLDQRLLTQVTKAVRLFDLQIGESLEFS